MVPADAGGRFGVVVVPEQIPGRCGWLNSPGGQRVPDGCQRIELATGFDVAVVGVEQIRWYPWAHDRVPLGVVADGAVGRLLALGSRASSASGVVGLRTALSSVTRSSAIAAGWPPAGVGLPSAWARPGPPAAPPEVGPVRSRPLSAGREPRSNRCSRSSSAGLPPAPAAPRRGARPWHVSRRPRYRISARQPPVPKRDSPP